MLELNKLNDAQRMAVMHGEGPLLVLAGPGSGKTFTITQRIFYLIEEKHVPPEQILVLTFTRDAAQSMQRRFQEQANRIYPVNFGTFHSIFFHILLHSNKQKPPKLLNNEHKKRILRSVLVQKKMSDDEMLSVLSAISYFKNTNSMKEACGMLPTEWQADFAEIYKAYEQERQRQAVLDFDDMLCECCKMFCDRKEILAYWQSRFTHILIDEFQDINPVQYQVIKLLAVKPYSIFAVGDDDQAIYGFRGSNPACIRRFADEFDAGQIHLSTNYRSRREIIDSSLRVISENKERFVKELCPSPANSQKPFEKDVFVLKSFSEKGEEYAYLRDKLRGRCGEGKMDTAVLFRTNSQMQIFAAGLTEEGIPFGMKEKSQSVYEHFIAKDILAYMRLAAGEEKRELWLQILNKPSRYLNREVLGTVGKERWCLPKGSEKYNIVKNLERQIAHLKKLSPYLAVQYISKVIGYEKYLKELADAKPSMREKQEEWRELLDWLKEDAAQYSCLEEWLEAQRRYGESKNSYTDKQISPVQLMTVHGAKGLEFDTVYIPDCNENVFPHGAMPDMQTCEEERRIFYVAMTRAKENLELLYLLGTRERPRLPSRFLNPLLNRNLQRE